LKKNVRVPGHDIKIDLSELLFINTATFQRLNHIKQLGLAYFVYPFALHTRASHCLDCMHIAQLFIDNLLVNVRSSSLLPKGDRDRVFERLQRDVASIRAAAVLHDIMHIPYAHTLEDENKVLEKGDKSRRINVMIENLAKELSELTPTQLNTEHLADYRTFSFATQTEFQQATRRAKDLLEDVRKVLWTIALHDAIEDKIRGVAQTSPIERVYNEAKKLVEQEHRDKSVTLLESDRYYIADLIGNTVSADLISYVLRDSEFTGIDSKPGGWYRVFDYLEIAQDNVGRNRLVIKLTKDGEWRQDVFSAIIRILNSRYDLTEQVTFHHAKLSASAMLGKLARLCQLSESEELYSIGDEGLFTLFDKKIEEIRNGKVAKGAELAEGAERLLRSLRQRRLHKRFHVITTKRHQEIDLPERYSDPKARESLESRIENDFGLKPGSIIIFCPTRHVTLKEAAALVAYERTNSGGVLEPIVNPLNSEDCLTFLKNEKDQETAMRVRNVEDQYAGLWKLYVFVDPAIIPVYGYEIKQILNQELGTSRSFDKSNLEAMEEYRLSRAISETIIKSRIPEIDKKDVLREIPVAIREAGGRSERITATSVTSKLDLVVRSAKDRVEAKRNQVQTRLP
jgi:HD superfamily phosphohydrolase